MYKVFNMYLCTVYKLKNNFYFLRKQYSNFPINVSNRLMSQLTFIIVRSIVSSKRTRQGFMFVLVRMVIHQKGKRCKLLFNRENPRLDSMGLNYAFVIFTLDEYFCQTDLTKSICFHRLCPALPTKRNDSDQDESFTQFWISGFPLFLSLSLPHLSLAPLSPGKTFQTSS